MLWAWLGGLAGGWLLAAALLHGAGRRAESLGRRAPGRAPGLPIAAPPAGAPWRIAVLGDLQRGVVDVPRALVSHLRDEPADLVLASGDLALTGEAPWHGLVQEALDRAGLDTPLRAVPGNHDLYPSRCRDERFGGPHFERHFGSRSWALDLGSWLLVGLDTGASWRADLEWPRVAAWLEAHPKTPWILLTHRPPWNFDRPGTPHYEDLAALPERLASRPPALVIAGHLGRSVDVERDGVRYLVNAAGGDLSGGGLRREPWQLVRVTASPDGSIDVATRRLARRRDPAIARDYRLLRWDRACRTTFGAILAAPIDLPLRACGRRVGSTKPPRRRAYPTREEAAAWLAEARPFAPETVSR